MLKMFFAVLVLVYSMSASASNPYDNRGFGNLAWTATRHFFSDGSFLKATSDMLEGWGYDDISGGKVIYKYNFIGEKLVAGVSVYTVSPPSMRDWNGVEQQLTESFGAANENSWTPAQKSLLDMKQMKKHSFRSNEKFLVVHSIMESNGIAYQTVTVAYSSEWAAYVQQVIQDQTPAS